MLKGFEMSNTFNVDTIKFWLSRATVIVIVLVVAEGITRLFILNPSPSTFDPQLDWMYRPNTLVFNGSEGGAHLITNEYGFNDDPIPAVKSKHRVLVMGDSFVAGLQIEREKHFVTQSEASLTCINFVNGGRGAIQPYQWLILLDRFKEPMQIDSLLLVFNTNDVYGVNARVHLSKGPDGRYTPEFPEYKEDLLRRSLDPLLRHSGLLTYLAQRLTAATTPPNNSKGIPLDERTVEIEKRQMLKDLLVTLSAKSDIKILYLPKLIYASNGLAEKTKLSASAWETLSSVAQELDIPAASTEKWFKESFIKTGQPATGFANKMLGGFHMNEMGHEAASKAVNSLYSQRCN